MKNFRKFEASEFVPTKWSPAEDKAKFANDFMRFVKSNFKATIFSKKFYTRLSSTFGHIAHYDRDGFYRYFFESTAGCVDFLEQTMAFPCYGDPAFTYSDVERAIQKALKEAGVLEQYRAKFAAEVEAAERATFLRLKAKFEPPPGRIYLGDVSSEGSEIESQIGFRLS